VRPDADDAAAYAQRLRASWVTEPPKLRSRIEVREPDWFEHLVLKGPDTNVNLPVFPAGCAEPERMLAFRDWLRANAADRELYAAAKRELAARDWTYVQQYADAKTAVVTEIMARAMGARGEIRDRS
jgi:GrpB-like predicted nucleotidyltransferase (UPF0157 family)